MAQKFNDGQTYGQIRTILNGNADELTSTSTTAKNAKTAADKAQKDIDDLKKTYAGNGKVGLVKSVALPILTGNPTVAKLTEIGDIEFNNGIGVSKLIRILSGNDLENLASTFSESKYSTIYVIDGEYTNGWKGSSSANYTAYALINFGKMVAVDLLEGVIWQYTGSEWRQVGAVPLSNEDEDGNAGLVRNAIPQGNLYKPFDLWNGIYGNVKFKDGIGNIERMTLAPNSDVRMIASHGNGSVWFLRPNYPYEGMWKEYAASPWGAFVFGMYGMAFAVNIEKAECWCYGDPTGGGQGLWKKVAGGGGGQSVVELKGGENLDTALAVKEGEVATYILPKATYTGAWYGMKYPFSEGALGECSAVVTVYPNGIKSAIVDGFGDDGGGTEDVPERNVFNGLCTYTPSTGWALAYNWPQTAAVPANLMEEAGDAR